MAYFKTLCRDIKLSKILDKIPKSETNEIINILEEELLECTHVNYPNSIFYKRKNSIMYEVNKSEKIIYVKCGLFDKLKIQYNLKHDEIKYLVKIFMNQDTEYFITISLINEINWDDLNV